MIKLKNKTELLATFIFITNSVLFAALTTISRFSTRTELKIKQYTISSNRKIKCKYYSRMTLVIKIVADQRRRINTITIPGYILNGLRISPATVCELLLYNTFSHTGTHTCILSLFLFVMLVVSVN